MNFIILFLYFCDWQDQERAPNRGKRAVEADCNGSPSIRDEFEVKVR